MLSSRPNTIEDRRRTLFGLLSDTYFRRLKIKYSKYSFGELILFSLLEREKLYGYEDWLWDYKRSLPNKPDSYKKGTPQYNNYNAKLCEFVKDIASFHNTAGGVLVFGVDNDGSILGCNIPHNRFVDDLDSKIKTTLKTTIDFQFIATTYKEKKIYLLVVPRRQTAEPLSFRTQATTSNSNDSSSKISFRQNDIYFRNNSECFPAKAISDIKERENFFSGRIVVPGLKLKPPRESGQRISTKWASVLGGLLAAFVILGTLYPDMVSVHSQQTRCELPDDRVEAILSGHSTDFKFLQAAKDHVCNMHIEFPNLSNQELTGFVLTFRDEWESIISDDIDRIEKAHDISLGPIRSALADDGFYEADDQLQTLEGMWRSQLNHSVAYLSDLHFLRASLALHVKGDLDKAFQHFEAAAEYFDELDDKRALWIRMDAAQRILVHDQLFPGDGAAIAEELIWKAIERWPDGVDVPVLAAVTSLLGSAAAVRGDVDSLKRSVVIFDLALDRMTVDSLGWNLTRVNRINALVTLKENLRRSGDANGVDEVDSLLKRAGAFDDDTLESAARLNGELFYEWSNSEQQNSTGDRWKQFEISTMQYIEGLELVLAIYKRHEFGAGMWRSLNDLGFANYRLAYKGFRSKPRVSREKLS